MIRIGTLMADVIEQCGGPVGGRAQERLVLEYAYVEKTVAHVARLASMDLRY